MVVEETAARRLADGGLNTLILGFGSKAEIIAQLGRLLCARGVPCVLVDGARRQRKKRRGRAEREILACVVNLAAEMRILRDPPLFGAAADELWHAVEARFGPPSPLSFVSAAAPPAMAVLVHSIDGVVATQDPSFTETLSRLASLPRIRVAASAVDFRASCAWTPAQRRGFGFAVLCASTYVPSTPGERQAIPPRPNAAELLQRPRKAGSTMAAAAEADRSTLEQLSEPQRALLFLVSDHVEQQQEQEQEQKVATRSARKKSKTDVVDMATMEQLAKDAMLFNTRARVEEAVAELCRLRFLVQSEGERGGRIWALSEIAQRAIALEDDDESSVDCGEVDEAVV